MTKQCDENTTVGVENPDFVAGNQPLKSSMAVAPGSPADKRALVNKGRSCTRRDKTRFFQFILLATSRAT
jgi:hypothetical protein